MDGLNSVAQRPERAAPALTRHRIAQHSLSEAAARTDSRRMRIERDASPATTEGVRSQATEDLPSQTTDVSADWQRKDKTSLQIRTADGDMVQLKFKSVSSAKMSSQVHESDGASSSEVQLETSQRTRISMRVHGELDAEELAAIQDTIAKAGEIASDFFSGDVQAAFDSAADFGITSDEIASVRLRMKSTERFTYSAHSATYGPAPAPELPSETDPPALVDEIPGGPPNGVQQQEPDSVGVAPASLVHSDMTPVEAEPTEHAQTEEPQHVDTTEAPSEPAREATIGGLADFLDGILTRIGADTANGTFSVGASFSRSISMTLKLRIVESVLVTAAESERPTEPLPEIVSDSIDDLVAQEQPPLESVA